MTNGEKIQTILDIDQDCTEVYGKNGMMTFSVPQNWWNAEYKEPTTKNDLTEQCIACKYDETEDENGEHCKKCLEGDSQFELDNEFVESTTENDLGVDCIDRDSIKYYPGQGGYMYASKGEIDKLPSVPPQPRKGHWIKGYTFPDGEYWKCDKCNKLIKVKYPMYYCNNCGSDNSREVEK